VLGAPQPEGSTEKASLNHRLVEAGGGATHPPLRHTFTCPSLHLLQPISDRTATGTDARAIELATWNRARCTAARRQRGESQPETPSCRTKNMDLTPTSPPHQPYLQPPHPHTTTPTPTPTVMAPREGGAHEAGGRQAPRQRHSKGGDKRVGARLALILLTCPHLSTPLHTSPQP